MTLQKSIDSFLRNLAHFDYQLSMIDHDWTILFPDARGKWIDLYVEKYNKTYYINHISDRDSNYTGLEIESGKPIKILESMGMGPCRNVEEDTFLGTQWASLIAASHNWLKMVRRDWIKANKKSSNGIPAEPSLWDCSKCLDKKLFSRFLST